VSALIESLAQHHLVRYPTEAAAILDVRSEAEAAATLSPLAPAARVEVLRAMSSVQAAAALAAFEPALAGETLLAADPVLAARWLGLLVAEERARLQASLPAAPARAIAEALDYPQGRAGALMDAGVLAVGQDTRVESVLAGLRRMQDRRVTDVMVCDDAQHLVGSVPLQALLGAAPDASLRGLVRETAVVTPMTTRDEVVELLERDRLPSLPVVDLDRRLLGVIRYDALVQAAQAEAAGDLSKMVGAGAEERALSSPLLTVRSRLPWLLINLMTAFTAASVVGLFDATIAQFTALAVLMPVVAGQSGNTGAQALAVTCRGLSLRELRTSQWWPLVRKETLAAAINGLVIAAVTAAGVAVWSGSAGLCAVIAASMVVSMMLAAFAGALIPILLTASGRDPATASSIVLTTVTDIMGFFSFLGLATLLKAWLV